MTWEPVIGIEVHVELATRSKMFCGCPVGFGAEPNTNVCPVCLGLPGALPVPNRKAIEWIMAIGLALDCEIAPLSQFHRKNYFYADLPKNFQISQYDEPICVSGHLDVEVDGRVDRVRIHRVHMEEDTGKSVHVGEAGRLHSAQHTLLDFNRSGVPLVEIVTEPDIRSAAEARAYAQTLRSVVASLGVSDAKLEEGSFRFDANISLRPAGSDGLGTKVEVKNMNSFRSLERAVQYEIDRQIAALEAGERLVQETRHWDEAAGVTHSMRIKEGSSDYRYFAEPDLVPIEVSRAWREDVAASLPELPAARRARYVEMGLDDHATGALVQGDERLAGLFEEAVAAGADTRSAANWLTGEVVAWLRRAGSNSSDIPLGAEHLAELSQMVDSGLLSATAAKEVLGGVMDGEGTPKAVAEARDLLQLTDRDALEAVVLEAIEANSEQFERLKSGEDKLIGFFVGQVMRETGGKADPKVVTDILRQRARS